MIASKCPAGKVTVRASEQTNSASGTFRAACWICSGKCRPRLRGTGSQVPRPREHRPRSPGREQPRRAAASWSALRSTQCAASGRCHAPAPDTGPRPCCSQFARSRRGRVSWPESLTPGLERSAAQSGSAGGTLRCRRRVGLARKDRAHLSHSHRS